MPKPSRYKPKDGDFVYVEWLDAFSIDAWSTREEAKILPCLIRSVGIVIECQLTHFTLGLSHDTVNDNFSSFLVVPRGMIQTIRKLDFVSKEKKNRK